MSSHSPTAIASTTTALSRQQWLIYPRKSFLYVRAVQVLLSFIFVLATSIPTTPGFDPFMAFILCLPVYGAAFIIYTTTLVAFINNPTRLSRVVVDPKLHPHPRKPLLPLPNKDNLSKKGATLTIVILEFLVAIYLLATFIVATIYGSFMFTETGPCALKYWIVDSSGKSPVMDEKAQSQCAAWVWSNDIIGLLGLSIMGFLTSAWGLKVYRAGWRESCKREMEREILEEMGRRSMNGKVGLRDGGIGEADVELGELPGNA